MTAVCCETCPFFVEVEDPASALDGLCYEGPGQVVAQPVFNQFGQPIPGRFHSTAVLPPKHKTDWCGRHPMFGLRAKEAASKLPPLAEAPQPEPRVLESEP